METIDQNRNFTVSAKTTAGQKARYIQEAQKHDISLSEWICSTLDLGLNTYGEVNKPIGHKIS